MFQVSRRIIINEIPQILIVDDEPSAQQTMEMLLLRKGYEIAFAADGYETLTHLDEETADVILLDMMMPAMDGFELCERLRQNPKWQHVPIILVTALDSKQDLARGLEAGADDFLHKPYNGLELHARVRSMLRIKQRHDTLQTTLQLRQDLSNMIVHNIRSPLSSIMIYYDLLKAELPGKSEALETIRSEAGRLSGFLTDMLMMAKMEHGRLMLSRVRVDMNELVTAVHDSFVQMARLKEIRLLLELPESTRNLTVDVNLWRRVLDNLLSNAIKFSPTDGQITLQIHYPTPEPATLAPAELTPAELAPAELAPAVSQATIQVLDERPGIPEEFQETIFDKFKIVASKRRDIAQVGLGLAFCKMIIEAHDGRIAISPNQPRGSIFTVQI